MTAGSGERRTSKHLLALSFATLGVVYGDIGTSPLYALRECFFGDYAVPATPENVLGVLSLIFWSLALVVSVKYLVFILRADNRGEGGVLALMALLGSDRGSMRRGRNTLVLLGLFGAALLYGDGMITPAISVLSAVEGLHLATPIFDPYVVPLTVAILSALFLLQSRGTAGVAVLFAPLNLLWFTVLATLGAASVAEEPHVLLALSPTYALRFFSDNGPTGFLVLGAVFLVVTGSEAIYADMGHFGKRPIRLAWFGVVFPSLLLNYFGQGALLLRHPEAARNPFYRLAPEWALLPMVFLATLATIIASQAVISGAFSLTRQAVQLGFAPRLRIEHTSSSTIGQIYVPFVNWILLLATTLLVFAFRSSSRLAAAYGVAVTTTMGITTVLFFYVLRRLWKWRLWSAFLLASAFLAVDGAFFGANIVKVEHGGWFPLAIAAAVFVLMTTWKRGREILYDRLRDAELPVDLFLVDLSTRPPLRVPGTAVFLSAKPTGVPRPVLHNLKHNKVLHERVVFLTVLVEDEPYVSPADRLAVEDLGLGLYRIVARYGFMESPHIREIADLARQKGLEFELMETSFFLGRENLIPTDRPGMALWRERLFALMSRNALSPTSFFGLPPNRVIELGQQVEL
ncbi:MAG: putative potassium transport system protein kup 1 [Candidatus Binatia bacterium]|nr:MAG: putative potassium transport system protein kup 1 [Candidatus Binatia bacterium]